MLNFSSIRFHLYSSLMALPLTAMAVEFPWGKDTTIPNNNNNEQMSLCNKQYGQS